MGKMLSLNMPGPQTNPNFSLCEMTLPHVTVEKGTQCLLTPVLLELYVCAVGSKAGSLFAFGVSTLSSLLILAICMVT